MEWISLKIQIILIPCIISFSLIRENRGCETYYMDECPKMKNATITLGATANGDSVVILKASKHELPHLGTFEIAIKPSNYKLGIVGTLGKFNFIGNESSVCQNKLQVWSQWNTLSNMTDELIYSDCSKIKFPNPLILQPSLQESLKFILEIVNSSIAVQFEITLTSFRNCRRRMGQSCIDHNFVRDGKRKCGDNSDERKFPSMKDKLQLPPNTIAFLVCLGFWTIFGITMGCITLVYSCRLAYYLNRRCVNPVPQPPQNQPLYQAHLDIPRYYGA